MSRAGAAQRGQEIPHRTVEPDLSDRDAASGRYVLRRKPPGKLLKMAHMIEREFRVLKALEGVGYPAPRALALCEDESVIGTAFYLMSLRRRPHALGPGAARARARERRPIYDAMNEGLARLHSIDVAAAGLRTMASPAAISPVNTSAGRISTGRAKRRGSRTWSASSPGSRTRCRRTTAASRWCTATGASTT